MEFSGKESRKLKSSDREEIVKIEKFAGEGAALAHDASGKVLFVRYVLPGELVKVKIYKEAKDYAMADPIEILESSPLRTQAPCPYFSYCGGCDYQILEYSQQLEMKKYLIEETFEHIAQMKVSVSGILASPKSLEYRNNMTYKVNPRKQLMGFFRKDSKSIIDIDRCMLEMPIISNAFQSMKKQHLLENEEFPFPPHNFKIRASITGEIGVYWVPSYEYQDQPVHETITVNEKSITYKISKDSFFQVNPYLVPLWIEKIISFLDKEKNERIVDLYCGIGLITLFVSHYAHETIGVEIAKASVQDALYNMQINDISSNVRFMLGDAGECLRQIGYADVIIVDPPRAGMDEFTRNLLLERAPKKIIYSSCKASTMARDIALLSQEYELKELYLVDMFPQTHHVELLSLLVRRNNL
ncbi:MAG: class I SAM-dependent RNA methyltransferase [Brevinemataceae bacterium]